MTEPIPTWNGARVAPADVDTKATKLALRIKQAVNKANGRIVQFQLIEAGDGVYWLYVDNGKREVIE